MGEHADDIIDQIIDGEWLPRRRNVTYQSGAGKGVWRTASGPVLRMSDMSVAHLQAAIAECERRGNSGKKADLEKALRGKVNEFFTPESD